ncbi:hypothetical protein J5N97_014576 [Dioscorea zingiberensis]|uniref:Peroxidase 1 n=1 Tax=Dioscorea zingiberensis TaxID=325984 RepID=A0A9D5CU67_9LILI|nr:hypothetical protein J5N97_014576 [Dioscorea zingiberensis]
MDDYSDRQPASSPLRRVLSLPCRRFPFLLACPGSFSNPFVWSRNLLSLYRQLRRWWRSFATPQPFLLAPRQCSLDRFHLYSNLMLPSANTCPDNGWELPSSLDPDRNLDIVDELSGMLINKDELANQFDQPGDCVKVSAEQVDILEQCPTLLLVGFLLHPHVQRPLFKAQLQVGFYNDKCLLAESIVKDEVMKALRSDSGLAAGLVRLHFHDAFVRGADASVLIDSTSNNTAEKDAPPNNPSLRGFEVIDSAKNRLEIACKGKVSCADILAFAARDSVLFSLGISYAVPSGRRDGRVSMASEALSNLPPPSFNLTQLTQIFNSNGFSQEEMIILSGAHTIGRSHCSSFTNRLYNFNSTVSQDPSLDPTYAEQLKKQCPNGSTNTSLVVPMDPKTPTIFDTNYYKLILANRGLFTSDQTLISTPEAKKLVQVNAYVPLLFPLKFRDAFVKMGKMGVLTGDEGEIRTNCRVIN